jgi:hypothetical protein
MKLDRATYYAKRFDIISKEINPALHAEAKLLKTLIGTETITDNNFHMNQLDVDCQLGKISQDLHILGFDFEEIVQYATHMFVVDSVGVNQMHNVIVAYEYTLGSLIADFIEANADFTEDQIDEIRSSFTLDVTYNDQMYALGYKQKGNKYSSTLELTNLFDTLPSFMSPKDGNEDYNEYLLSKLVEYSRVWKDENIIKIYAEKSSDAQIQPTAQQGLDTIKIAELAAGVPAQHEDLK